MRSNTRQRVEEMLSRGMRQVDIARELSVSKQVVWNHVAAIRRGYTGTAEQSRTRKLKRMSDAELHEKMGKLRVWIGEIAAEILERKSKP